MTPVIAPFGLIATLRMLKVPTWIALRWGVTLTHERVATRPAARFSGQIGAPLSISSKHLLDAIKRAPMKVSTPIIPPPLPGVEFVSRYESKAVVGRVALGFSGASEAKSNA